MRTFVVEIGTGVDLHGQDSTGAAIKALRNAFAHVSLPGLRAVAGVNDFSQVEIEALLGVPEGARPIDVERVAATFPMGRATVKTQTGGLLAHGGGVDPNDRILMINAIITVRVP